MTLDAALTAAQEYAADRVQLEADNERLREELGECRSNLHQYSSDDDCEYSDDPPGDDCGEDCRRCNARRAESAADAALDTTAGSYELEVKSRV